MTLDDYYSGDYTGEDVTTPSSDGGFSFTDLISGLGAAATAAIGVAGALKAKPGATVPVAPGATVRAPGQGQWWQSPLVWAAGVLVVGLGLVLLLRRK